MARCNRLSRSGVRYILSKMSRRHGLPGNENNKKSY